MEDKAKAMVLASFVADSLALAAHWIYDVDRIDREFGIIDQLTSPAANSYHAHRRKGQLTHYGDQTLLLLQSLGKEDGFSPVRFAAQWHGFSSSYDGYLDHATKETLRRMAVENPLASGSSSTDLGGPARIAPLVYLYHDDRGKLLEAAWQQTSLTHTGAGMKAGSDCIAKLAFAVLHGSPPAEAIEMVLSEGVADPELGLRLRQSIATIGADSRRTIGEFGQMCAINAALPGALHLILSYQDNLQEALIQNVMAGGDSAARGLVVGMVLGAHLGMAAIPPSWLADLQAHKAIVDCLERLQ